MDRIRKYHPAWDNKRTYMVCKVLGGKEAAEGKKWAGPGMGNRQERCPECHEIE